MLGPICPLCSHDVEHCCLTTLETYDIHDGFFVCRASSSSRIILISGKVRSTNTVNCAYVCYSWSIAHQFQGAATSDQSIIQSHSSSFASIKACKRILNHHGVPNPILRSSQKGDSLFPEYDHVSSLRVGGIPSSAVDGLVLSAGIDDGPSRWRNWGRGMTQLPLSPLSSNLADRISRNTPSIRL